MYCIDCGYFFPRKNSPQGTCSIKGTVHQYRSPCESWTHYLAMTDTPAPRESRSKDGFYATKKWKKRKNSGKF